MEERSTRVTYILRSRQPQSKCVAGCVLREARAVRLRICLYMVLRVFYAGDGPEKYFVQKKNRAKDEEVAHT